MPKSGRWVTANAIVEALRKADEPLTALAVAEATGLSPTTAQRYRSDLSRAGRVELSLRYGATGRPEHRYGCASSPTEPPVITRCPTTQMDSRAG